MNYSDRSTLLIFCIFAFGIMASLLLSQEPKDSYARTMTLKGTIKSDGDKYTFVNDKDGKSWEITNPEALKGHEGHHVQLNAHVYADKDEMHVMGIKMMAGGNDKSSSSGDDKRSPGGPPTGGDPPPPPHQ